ncbi:hypothetical protein AAFF_G00070220 [Aldrovandia affinis]|nr:hypothetical protein AAFF_G00070220 [Aldrovandia affinis]
MKKCWPL